jgi:hypothetical protein
MLDHGSGRLGRSRIGIYGLKISQTFGGYYIEGSTVAEQARRQIDRLIVLPSTGAASARAAGDKQYASQ